MPDDVVVRMVLDRLDEEDAPRVHPGRVPADGPAGAGVGERARRAETPLGAVLKFSIPDEIGGDASPAGGPARCQRTYNMEWPPAADEGVRRRRARSGCASDDTEETVRRRLRCTDQTEPLECYYWERGLFRQVDAEGTEDEVTERRSTRSRTCWREGSP